MSIPAHIIELDKNDALSELRAEFLLHEGLIYMDGNSLGPVSKGAKRRVQETLEQQWQQDLIKSWNAHNWIDLPRIVGDKIAPIIGAKAGQVICTDSISVNLFKLLSAALAMQPSRRIIVSEQTNFPTDLYMAEGLAQQLGKSRCELKTVAKADIGKALTEDVAALMLTHVDFRTGEMLDMQAITQQAHDKGILVIWDLAHSAGAVPLALDLHNVDFAVGCGYKYLNGGPGSPAFIYVAERHLEQFNQPLSGWMGHAKPFDFAASYKPAPGIDRALCGTPPVLSLAALDGALEIFDDIEINQLRSKSQDLKVTLLEALAQHKLENESLKLITPTTPDKQGSQLSFSHPHAYAISQALIDANVIVDFRAPNIVRFGFTPLTLSFTEVYQAAEVLADILRRRTYLDGRFSERSKVT